MDSSSPVVVPAAEPGGEKVSSEGRPKYEYSAEVLGLVDTSYEFPGTCVSLQVQCLNSSFAQLEAYTILSQRPYHMCSNYVSLKIKLAM